MHPESGILMIKVKMPDSLSSSLKYLVTDTFTEKVTRHKIAKAQVTYDFVETNYQRAKERYLKNEENFIEFEDENLDFYGAKTKV